MQRIFLTFSNRPRREVADTGVNAILGYFVIANLVWSIVGLSGLEAFINSLTGNPHTSRRRPSRGLESVTASLFPNPLGWR